jgi:hypothetical protein
MLYLPFIGSTTSQEHHRWEPNLQYVSHWETHPNHSVCTRTHPQTQTQIRTGKPKTIEVNHNFCKNGLWFFVLFYFSLECIVKGSGLDTGGWKFIAKSTGQMCAQYFYKPDWDL